MTDSQRHVPCEPNDTPHGGAAVARAPQFPGPRGSDGEAQTRKGEARAEQVLALVTTMERLGVRVWVHGGWAIDALTGTSRSHEDIDLLADEADRARLRSAFATSLVAETTHKLELSFEGVPVEVTFFRRLASGRLVTLTPRLIVRWDPESLGTARAPLGGGEIPVVGTGALYMEVANRVRKKPPMLAKNARDLERLAPLLTPAIKERAQRFEPLPNTRWNRIRLRVGLL